MLKAVVALCAVAAALADGPIGGENFGIPLAPLPIPFDKCRFVDAPIVLRCLLLLCVHRIRRLLLGVHTMFGNFLLAP